MQPLPLQLSPLATAGAGDDYFLPAEKLLVGNPKQTLWAQYTDATAQLSTGYWRSEPGKWHVNYTEEEFCTLLEGSSTITSLQGASMTVTAGDSFMVPRGFVGTWEVTATTTKRFVVYEATVATDTPAPRPSK
jgi:uncharacterized protein